MSDENRPEKMLEKIDMVRAPLWFEKGNAPATQARGGHFGIGCHKVGRKGNAAGRAGLRRRGNEYKK